MVYTVKRIEHPNFQVDEDLALIIANVTQRLFDEVRRQEEELFTTDFIMRPCEPMLHVNDCP